MKAAGLTPRGFKSRPLRVTQTQAPAVTQRRHSHAWSDYFPIPDVLQVSATGDVIIWARLCLVQGCQKMEWRETRPRV